MDNAAQTVFQVTTIAPPSVHTVAYANGVFTLHVTGQPGVPYVIEVSTDLNTWTAVSTNTSVTGTFQFSDLNAGSYPFRFYRARVGP